MADPVYMGDGVWLARRDQHTCAACGYVTNASGSDTAGAAPVEGDCSLCLNCGHLSTYNGRGLDRRPSTDAELAEFAADPEVQRMRLRILFRGPFR